MAEDTAQTKSTTLRDPKALTPEYHKAHKQLMLWASILFVWEFVGIDLEQAKNAEGYTGALIKAIKSPQAVPWALLLLVGYFLFKCSLEWAQCHIDRRQVIFAKIDFVSALVVSAAAIVLYLGQTISRTQFADILKNEDVGISVLIGISTAVTLIVVGSWLLGGVSRSFLLLTIVLFVATIIFEVAKIIRGVRPRVIPILITAGVTVGVMFFVRIIIAMKTRVPPEN